jgi:hypothetical protein
MKICQYYLSKLYSKFKEELEKVIFSYYTFMEDLDAFEGSMNIAFV